jgi:pimeloyl-[acyl-carrier protein] synthase
MSEAKLESPWPIPVDDPYPGLDKLRAQGPVQWLPALEAHLVVSHAAATAVLQGGSWSSDPAKSPRLAARLGLTENIGRSLLFSDPPDHVRLRRTLRGHLSPRAVEAFRPRINDIVSSAFAGLEPDRSFDVMNTLAYPVPLAVICELFGAPPDLAEMLWDETPRMIDMLDPLADPEAIQVGAAAALGVMIGLVPLVADRRIRPGNDLLSVLAEATSSGELEVDEAISMALLLLAAGHETTANLVGNAVVALHAQPDIARLVRRQPALMSRAVDELLRFDSPVQLTSRVATQDDSIAGVKVGAGEQVLLSLGAANRDPAVFPNPGRIDPYRDVGRSLAFGHGAHFCAGAVLARSEAGEILRRLLDLHPALEDRELSVERGTSATFRRFTSLRLDPA